MCESFNGTCIAATTAGVASCTALSGTVDYGGCGGSTDDDDGGCACCKYESNSTSTTNSSAADDDGDDGDDDASATCASPGLTSYEEAMCGYSSGTCYANTTAGRAACDGDALPTINHVPQTQEGLDRRVAARPLRLRVLPSFGARRDAFTP